MQHKLIWAQTYNNLKLITVFFPKEKNKATGQSQSLCSWEAALNSRCKSEESRSLMMQRNEARFLSIFSKQILERRTNHILKDNTIKEDCKSNYKQSEIDN